MQTLLTVEQLSKYLHKSVPSIRSDATRNPRSLPPLCRLPGTKRLLWRVQDVENWVAEHVIGFTKRGNTEVFRTDDVTTAKRGRPTKAEQIARQQLLTGAPTSDQVHFNTKG